jgi:hypothetical protein
MKYIKGYIYKVTNIITGKIYIGQTINLEKRKNDHLRDKRMYYFHNELRKYGEKYDGSNGYNMNDGGKGNPGRKHSKETKLKIGKANKGYTPTEETLLKISKKLKGRKLSKSHIKKISLIHKGKIVSEETRERISKNNKGRKDSDEVRLKKSKATLNNTNSRDKKIYIFYNNITSDEFIGTRYDFSKKYNFKLSGVNDLFRKNRPSKSYKKWRIKK